MVLFSLRFVFIFENRCQIHFFFFDTDIKKQWLIEKVKQLANQPQMLKKNLIGPWVKIFIFSVFSPLKLNFSITVLAQISCAHQYLEHIPLAIEKLLILCNSYLCARPIKVVSVWTQIFRRNFVKSKFCKLLSNF